MTIQWSSAVAQEMLAHLVRANQQVEDGIQQSARLREALRDADVDGENRVLRQAIARCDALDRRLKRYEETLEAFRIAVRRADELFDEAEKQVSHFADRIDCETAAPDAVAGEATYAGLRAAAWRPSAYAVMPELRVSAAPEPEWLRAAVRNDALK